MDSESIYSLIPQPVEMPAKPARYHSKHPGAVPPTFSTFGLTGTSKPGYTNVAGAEGMVSEGHHLYQKPHATMGKEGNARKTSDVLKKGSGGGGGAAAASNAPAGDFKYGASRRPTVPTVSECKAARAEVEKKTGSSKNFITSNAVENILAVPKREKEQHDWLKKPHFGNVPPYLRKIKKEIADEYEYIRAMQQQQQQDDGAPAGMRLLGDEERLQLIDDLKAKWDQVNVTYQQSSVLSLASLDTIGKVKRKEMYEAQLAQIEKDIEKLSKKFVYVAEEA